MRGIETDGLKYYQEKNGDYLSINPETNAFYREHLNRNSFEGRSTAIAGMMESICTTGISASYLKQCKRVAKNSIPKEWLDRL